MNQYERRFFEDIHKLVKIQEEILKELQKMNKKERLVEVDEEAKVNFPLILTEDELEEEWNRIKESE